MNEVKLQGAGPVGVWRFGAAVLNEALAELRVAGQTVALDRSSHDVLLALLRHAGEVVTKDELLEAGWPERVVSENSLAKAISRLRTALAGDGDALKSVHGYGYRLAATVVYNPTPQPSEMPPPTRQPGQLRKGECLALRPGWRLVRPLGEGGAGVIWLAESRDGQHRAIKFAASEADLRCLKREIGLSRYIQAVRPDLPGVAPVLGSNLAEPPFFLEMPHYPYGDLREWAVAHDWAAQPLIQRLELFASLCDAVAALHEIGLIHKDLKPENLYPDLGPDGHWRIVLSDLGAGEALPSPQLAQMGFTLTLTTEQLSPQAGSLMYLAPEVLAGEMPTQRSDVFSLGELLYQFIVGDLRRPLAPGWEEDIDDELLREDIALAAATRPERRQIDAGELAQRIRDLHSRHAARLEEHRRSEALARQTAQLARLRQRRRWLLAATAMLAAVLTLSLWQQWRTAKAHAQAQLASSEAAREARKARGLVEFFTDGVLRQADPFASAGADITLRQAIDNAAADVDARFGNNPDVAASIHSSLGATYEGMNDFSAAIAQYEKRLAALQRQSPRDLTAIAYAWGDLCEEHQWGGSTESVADACAQAIKAYRAAGLPPDKPEVILAHSDNKRGRYAAALARLQPALLQRLRRSGEDDTLGFALWFASIAHTRLGQLDRAEAMGAQLVEVRRRQSGDASMDVAWAHTEHGNVLLLLGRETEGRAELRQAEANFAAMAAAQHPQAQAPKVFLANYESLHSRWQPAAELARSAFDNGYASVQWSDHWVVYAAAHLLLAEARLGHATQARKLLHDMQQAITPETLHNQPHLREPVWTSYVRSQLALGDIVAAQRQLQPLRELLLDPATATPPGRAKIACLDAELALARGEPAQARAPARQCLDMYAQTLPPQSPLLLWPRQLLAQATT